jgi:phosphoenolpyruvate synthase/pyruvate phosphate dikinase
VKFVAWFGEVNKDDGALVGGKGANLGELTRASATNGSSRSDTMVADG